MAAISLLIRWSCLLGVALLAPVGLPAGGAAATGKAPIRRSSKANSLFAGTSCFLKTSPLNVAPTLRNLDVGTPLKPLRSWTTDDGQHWLYVQLTSLEFSGLNTCIRRGWISIV